MPTCFVIQKFDKGKYDKRYRDIFEPAIKGAGYDPYRVDRDPSASVPIQEIERQIAAADVCFAEISEDNPNVWFELGFAFASNKEVCIVCSSERQSRFPFDIQHRLITSYSTDSKSDYEEAYEQIKRRLIAIKSKKITLGEIRQEVVLRARQGVTDHELSCLCVILQNRYDPSEETSNSVIVQDMEKLGYTRLATQIALHKLMKKEFIQSRVEDHYDSFHQQSYSVTMFGITDLGMDFLISQEMQLDLFDAEPNDPEPRQDDDIPF